MDAHATATALREAGQEHACVAAMLSKTVAEFLGEEKLLAARLSVKGKPGHGHGQQAPHFAHGDCSAQEREQNSCVDRMTNAAVGAAANQLVSLFERHNSAPVGAKVPARPKRDAHTC